MAINLHEKYEPQIVKALTHESYTQGKKNEKYSWEGVKTIHVPSIVTQALGDYTRSGTARYGTPQELQDTTQEMTVSKDRAFAITIDKGNNMEQQMMKNAGEVLRQEQAEQVVPEIDKYAFKTWTDKIRSDATIGTGKSKNVVTEASFSDNDAILTSLSTGKGFLANLLYQKNLNVFMGWTLYQKLVLAKMILGIETLGKDQITKGVVGNLFGMPITAVPDDYLPDVNYFIAYKDAILNPVKLREARIHQDPPGISGALLEGRYIYDAFVLDQYKTGIYISEKKAYSAG